MFDNSGDTPAEGVDFSFNFSDPDAPAVDLREGDDGAGTTYQWRIWCEDSAGDEANMGAITGSLAEDYDVSILDDTGGPGAINVGGANLDPSSQYNFSRIRLANITGDLSGTTFLQKRNFQGPPSQDPQHGDIRDLTVGGSITGNVTAQQFYIVTVENDVSGDLTMNLLYNYVLVKGDVSGDIVVDAIQDTYELEVLGDVSGDITIDKFEFGAKLQIDGTASGAIHILQDLEKSGATNAVVQIGTFTGSLDIDGDLEGRVEINGLSSGTVNVDGVTSGTIDILSHSSGAITLVGETSGDIIVGGTLNRQITLSDNLTSTGSITVGDLRSSIAISLDCAGDIIVNEQLLGDVDITGDLTGSITIDKSINSRGRILVGGLIDGLVSVGTETVMLSQIRAVDGLGSSGCIIINADEGAYDANGTIYFGPPIVIPDPPPPMGFDVTFDGGIKIFDAGAGGSGNLEGTITVTGCHAGPDDLDICVDGSINGSITLNQTECTPQVEPSCVGNCP